MSILGQIHSDIFKTIKLFRLFLRSRYFGSRFGVVWAILSPLLMLLLYIFVFTFIMRVTVVGSDNPLDYVRWFICGFSPWMMINESVVSSCVAIVNNVQIAKNFPIKKELLPIASAFLGLPQLTVGLVVFFVLTLITGAGLSWNFLWILMLLPLSLAFLSGLSFFLSALTVFFRDIQQVIGTVLVALMFLSSVFNPMESLPIWMQAIMKVNPFYWLLEFYRQVLFYKSHPNGYGVLYITVLSLLLWFFGLHFFRKKSGYFESAL